MQGLAVDLHFFVPTISEATARTCALVCLTSTYPEAVAIRIIDVMAARKQAGEDVATVFSLMVSVMLGKVTRAKLEIQESRHETLLGAVCRAMYRIGSPGEQEMCFVSFFSGTFLQKMSMAIHSFCVQACFGLMS